LTLTARVSQITSAPITNRAEVASSDQFDPNSTPNNQRAGEDDQAEVTITPIPVADITVAKLPPAQLNPGTDAVYTIVVKNLGPSIAQSVTLADPGPAGLVFKSASCGSPPCALGNLAPGEDRTLTFTYSVPFPYTGSNVVTNVATATSGTFDPDPSNNTDRVGASIDARADLNVVKTGPATIVPGTSATYSLVVTNRGPSSAGDVVLEDPAQAGLTITAVSGAGCTALPCSLGTLAVNATATVTVTAKLDPAAVPGSTVKNSATVTSTTPDPNLFDNGSTAVSTVAPRSADLRVTKTGPVALSAGKRAVYTITVTNDGPSAAPDVIVNDIPGAGLTLVSVSGGNCVAVPCALGTMLPAQMIVLRVEVQVSAAATDGQRLSNAATVSSPAADPNSNNNTSTFTAPVGDLFADVSVKKTGPSSAKPGELINYTITVSNAGPADAQAVAISDTPSAGLSVVSATGACTALPCTLPTLAANASATVTVSARLAATTTPGATLTNRATAVSATPDLSPDNNTGETSLVVAPIADLVTTITGPTQFTVGVSQPYEFVVTNQGGAPTTGPITLVITLPQGAVVTLTQPAGWTYTLVGSTLTLTSNNVLPSLGSVRFPIQLSFPLDGAGRIDARVGGGGEAVTTNNDATLALSGTAVVIPTLSVGALLLLMSLMLATVIGLRRR
jgi:large repetitive protein